MTEYREVTLEERKALFEEGVFDINGNIPAHPGYTGIHHHKDGTYWWHIGEQKQITDPDDIYIIEHREEIKEKGIKDKEDAIKYRDGDYKVGILPRIKSLFRRSK